MMHSHGLAFYHKNIQHFRPFFFRFKYPVSFLFFTILTVGVVYGSLKPNTNHGQLFYGVEQAFEKKNHNKRKGFGGDLKLTVLMYWEICEGEGSIIFRVLT